MAFRVASLLLAVLFAYAASIQLNDPDPGRWIAVYGIAALISLLAVFRPPRPIVPWVLAVLALGWAATLVPGIYREAAFTGTEEERELVGLVIVAAWMGAVGAAGRRIRTRRRSRPV